MIACTNIQNFVEEGENCASTISMERLETLFHTLGSDMNLFGSIFKFQDHPFMLVVFLINFGVKNQVPQVSFKIVARDSMLVFSHEFADIIFCEYWLFMNLYHIMELNHFLSTVLGILYLII